MIIEVSTYSGRLIGLTGYEGSGKDTLADGLVDSLCYTKMGFADPLRAIAVLTNPDIKEAGECLKDLVDRLGWDKAKREYIEIREHLQWLGDLLRENVAKDVFIYSLMQRAAPLLKAGKNVVVTDVRYANEVKAITGAGGRVVHIDRPGVQPVNNHSSASGEAFPLADIKIENNEDAEAFRKRASDIHDILFVDSGKEDVLGVYQKTIERSIAEAIRYVLHVAAPASGATQEWMNRHRVELSALNSKQIDILVDDEPAGEVSYQDNVITVDAYVAR